MLEIYTPAAAAIVGAGATTTTYIELVNSALLLLCIGCFYFSPFFFRVAAPAMILERKKNAAPTFLLFHRVGTNIVYY
jgi:hypothetical protein